MSCLAALPVRTAALAAAGNLCQGGPHGEQAADLRADGVSPGRGLLLSSRGLTQRPPAPVAGPAASRTPPVSLLASVPPPFPASASPRPPALSPAMPPDARSSGWGTTVVVLHAHPDDEAIFTGATIRHLADCGVRVVVVTATAGEEGVPRVPLRPGESMRERRLAELERSCELLGVQRLVVLGLRDSGAHHGPFAAGTLGAAPVRLVARQVEQVLHRERAAALVHYDHRGIYGHADHVRVHEVGARAVRRLGITGYQATVDAHQLRSGPRHVLQQAAGDGLEDAGVAPARITLTLRASAPALLAKMAAMAAHASQIGPEYLDPASFTAGYQHEWYVRTGPVGVLDLLAGPHPRPPAAVPVPAGAGSRA